jgi:hypothetical protein
VSSKLVRTYENRSETVPTEYYTKAYYDGLREGATRSAEVIVPLVLQLLPVRSVVDVGCGEGAWLAAFRNSAWMMCLASTATTSTATFCKFRRTAFNRQICRSR